MLLGYPDRLFRSLEQATDAGQLLWPGQTHASTTGIVRLTQTLF